MPRRPCTVCGASVEIPRKVNGDGPTEVKCDFCGAKAPLRFRRRNGNVGGLKSGFVSTDGYPNHIRRARVR